MPKPVSVSQLKLKDLHFEQHNLRQTNGRNFQSPEDVR